MEEQPVAVESPFANEPEVDNYADTPEDESGIEVEEETDDELEEDDAELGDEDEESDDEESEGDEEELSDEEIDKLLEDLEDDDETEEAPNTVPHAALHQERERRKAVQAQLGTLSNEMQSQQELLTQYENSMDSVMKQLKEFDLLDVVSVDAPEKVSPELAAARQQQQEQLAVENANTLVGSVRSEAEGFLSEFPMIDGTDPGQAEIIVGLALASMQFGTDQEEAVHHAMKVFNGIIAGERKAQIRNGKKVASRKAAPSSKKTVRKTNKAKGVKVTPGNTKSYFDNMASERLR